MDGLSPDEIVILAETRYTDGGSERHEQLFRFALDVMDQYAKELEKMGSAEPLPYLATSPVQAAVDGVFENLQARRDPTWDRGEA